MFRWWDSNIYSCGGSSNLAEFFSPIQVTDKKHQRAASFFCHPGSNSNTALVQHLWNSKFPIPINNVNIHLDGVNEWNKGVASLYTFYSTQQVVNEKSNIWLSYTVKNTLFFPKLCSKWGQHLPHRDGMRLHSLIFAKCFEILGWEALQKCKGLSVIKRKEKVQQLAGIRGK